MPDTQGQETPAEGITAPAMPTEEKPIEADQTQPEAPASAEGELPADTSERTRQEFEKLKAKNRELAEQLRLKEQQNRPASVMDEFYMPPIQEVQEVPQEYQDPSQGQPEGFKQSLVDGDGYLDAQTLERTLQEVEARQRQNDERARRAEERARKAEERVSRFEHSEITRKLHASFPQADPYSEKFDPTFYNHLKKELVFQMTQGKTDPIEAAKSVSAYYRPPTVESSKGDETIAQRQQASTQAGGKRGTPTKFSEEDLVRGTRQGNLDAFGERLKRSGF